MSMQSFREAAARLSAIDELQDDLLRQLEELEQRTEAVLRECLPAGAVAPPDTVAQPAPKTRQFGSRQTGTRQTGRKAA
jgi:hypothetical protein